MQSQRNAEATFRVTWYENSSKNDANVKAMLGKPVQHWMTLRMVAAKKFLSTGKIRSNRAKQAQGVSSIYKTTINLQYIRHVIGEPKALKRGVTELI